MWFDVAEAVSADVQDKSRIARRNRDDLTGTGVSTLPSFRLAHTECAEASQIQAFADGRTATHQITTLIPDTLKEMQRKAAAKSAGRD